MTPGEFVLRTLFAEFTVLAEKKIETILSEPLVSLCINIEFRCIGFVYGEITERFIQSEIYCKVADCEYHKSSPAHGFCLQLLTLSLVSDLGIIDTVQFIR